MCIRRLQSSNGLKKYIKPETSYASLPYLILCHVIKLTLYAYIENI
jgi:hypothetical protein